MGYEAGVKAILDAQIKYDDVETGVACCCYGDTTSGQRIHYQFGMSTTKPQPCLSNTPRAVHSSTVVILHAVGTAGVLENFYVVCAAVM